MGQQGTRGSALQLPEAPGSEDPFPNLLQDKKEPANTGLVAQGHTEPRRVPRCTLSPQNAPCSYRNPGIGPSHTARYTQTCSPEDISKRKKSRLSHTQRQDTQSHKCPELTRSLTHSDTGPGETDLQGRAVGETISNIPRGTSPHPPRGASVTASGGCSFPADRPPSHTVSHTQPGSQGRGLEQPQGHESQNQHLPKSPTRSPSRTPSLPHCHPQTGISHTHTHSLTHGHPQTEVTPAPTVSLKVTPKQRSRLHTQTG